MTKLNQSFIARIVTLQFLCMGAIWPCFAESRLPRLDQFLLLQVYDYSTTTDIIHLAGTSLSIRTSLQEEIAKSERVFDLSEKTINDSQFIALFSELGIFNQIKKLNLSHSKFNPKLLSLLPKTIEELNLAENELCSIGVTGISHLINLKNLNLEGNNIGVDGALEVAKLKNLQILNLSGNRILTGGAEAISELEQLVTLDLSHNKIMHFILKTTNLNGLKNLNLSDNLIGPSEAGHISALVNLETLNLSNNKIEDLTNTQFENLNQLKTLNLGKNELKNHCAKAISKIKSLVSLSIYENFIEYTGAEEIALLPKLRDLDLTKNSIDKTQERELQTKFPEHHFTFLKPDNIDPFEQS